MMMNKHVFVLFLFCCASAQLPAQSFLDSLGAEDLFLRGRELAFSGQRDSARLLLNKALEKSPNYADIRILLARTYAWDGLRTVARMELATVLEQKKGYRDAYDAAIDVEMWDDKYTDALRLCNEAIRYFPNDEELLVKKVKVYRALNRDQEALLTISILEDINRSNPNIEALRESISTKGILNSAGISYSYDWTSESPRPNQIAALQYSRSTRYGTVIGRINMADRRRKTKLQYEVEAYPSIMGGVYAYVNYGYADTANAVLFPAHRIGLELFFSLPASFEASIGSRHLYFDPKPVNIYTGSLGYYIGNYWISLRSYITPGDFSVSRSVSLTTRWYFGEGHYLFGKAGGGVSPDEDRFIDSAGAAIYNIGSTGLGAGIHYNFDPFSAVTTSFDYSNQELSYDRGTYMDVYSFSVSYKYKF
ncbi:MAG: YaiO family outer membrane beta-barrel protein [Bacteroidetes bacterium]|nr:YaiO family outer membrane beta-barrel protein [Bacteroidota bacterium]